MFYFIEIKERDKIQNGLNQDRGPGELSIRTGTFDPNQSAFIEAREHGFWRSVLMMGRSIRLLPRLCFWAEQSKH